MRGTEWRKFERDQLLTTDEVVHAVLAARRRRVRVAGTAPQETGPTPFGRLVWALSLLHAGDAEVDQGVSWFRANRLGDRLLQQGEITEWIETRAGERPDDIAGFVLVPITAAEDATMKLPDAGRRWMTMSLEAGERRVMGTSWPYFIEYPAAGAVARLHVAPNTVIDELRQLSERLSAAHPWQRAQATAFVLTGAIPIAQLFRMTGSIGSHDPRYSVEVDARVPVDMISKACLATQRSLLGRRKRLPRERGINLAVMDLENPGISDGALLRLFNETYPASAFGDDLRAMRQARRDTLRCLGAVPGQPEPQSAS